MKISILTMALTYSPVALGSEAPELQSLELASKSQKRSKKRLTAATKLALIKRDFRLGKADQKKTWQRLVSLYSFQNRLELKTKISLLQTLSQFLLRDGYPLLSSLYASQAISAAKDPLAKNLSRSWSILNNLSADHPIQTNLEVLAKSVDMKGKDAPFLKSDWYYFSGSSLRNSGKTKEAIAAWNKVRPESPFYAQASYQKGIAHVELKQNAEAEKSLKRILTAGDEGLLEMNDEGREEIMNMARLSLARLAYEGRKFRDAINYYRSVTKGSPQYYDALFEQSWALFLGGYPNHALGALHSVDSPFFADRFNPESQVLRSMVYYWLCNYQLASFALEDFQNQNAKKVESLTAFLDRKNLTKETAYRLFENLISGVSSTSLQVPREILLSASSRDSLHTKRVQYASVLEERNRLRNRGVFGVKKGIEKPKGYMDKWVAAIRSDLGRVFLGELMIMKEDFARLEEQAEFLSLELLMSQKDQILGKELHASTKISQTNTDKAVEGWNSSKNQSWAAGDKGEYWWDEIGFYIYQEQPQCNE